MTTLAHPFHISDAELFARAVWHARIARESRAKAAAAGDDRIARNMANGKARVAERCVADLSITAEKRCLHELEHNSKEAQP